MFKYKSDFSPIRNYFCFGCASVNFLDIINKSNIKLFLLLKFPSKDKKLFLKCVI